MKGLIFAIATILLFLWLKSKATLGLFTYGIIIAMICLAYMAGNSSDYEGLMKIKKSFDTKLDEYLQTMKASFQETQQRLKEQHGHSN